MTYVSRRTRIIVSRWLDECDAEYRLRACRIRSDARLKKYSSCDDIRAWINDNCVKHEYLTDQMSNGGFSGSPPFRLYGRFIPVPILFQLTQSSKTFEGDVNVKRFESAGILPGVENKELDKRRNSRDSSNSEKDTLEGSNALSNSNFIRVEWEKNQLEKSLLQCTTLLNKAIKKLENIDGIVGFLDKRTECERTEEIQSAFEKSKMSCSCSALTNSNNTVASSKCQDKKSKDSIKCNELLRKISGLREKLKKIQECRHEVNHQIRSSKRRLECASSLQVTELYSRGEETHVKKLQKKLERLISERGRLLSEMCQALTCLNNIKRSSKSSMSFRKRDSKSFKSKTDVQSEKLGEPPRCNCGCQCSDNEQRSSDSMKHSCSESSSEYSDNEYSYKKQKQMDQYFANGGQTTSEDSNKFQNQYTEQYNPGSDSNNDVQKITDYKKTRRSSNASNYTNASNATQIIESPQSLAPESMKAENASVKPVENKKKSKVTFICPKSPCREKLDADDISAFQGSLSAEQQAMISCVLKDIQTARPNTSPTTKHERRTASLEIQGNAVRNNQFGQSGAEYSKFRRNGLDRRVKSETTMKEIEKTLRNYEWRLCNLEGLEGRVEQMKEKLSEAERMKKCLTKATTDVRMQKAAEKEKSEREITRLCSENWELKKQFQQLAAKYNEQTKKIQNLKCDAMRARELECHAEELQKELSEYRDGFEHQRKCITKWESVVAVQRTEIENLMNHIRKLTTMHQQSDENYQERRCVQRSRSYSPEMAKKRGNTNRSNAPQRSNKPPLDDDDNYCYCDDCPKQDNRRTSLLAASGYSPPSSRRRGWCN